MNEEAKGVGKLATLFSRARVLVRYLWVRALDIFIENLALAVANGRLFSGLALLLVGIFGFESDRYCDGNTATYLSCTRPSTYYYYSGFDIVIIVLGAALIVLWFLDQRSKKR